MYQNYDQNNDEQKNAEYSWQGDYYHSYRQPTVNTNTQSTDAAKKKNSGKVLLIIIAAILGCAIISAATIGVFVSLVNNGTIALNGTSAETENPAYTITKLIDPDAPLPDGTDKVRALSVKEIASKILPSIVCIQNYQITTSNDIFSFFMQQNSTGGDLSPAGEGSGIISSSDGYIITNAHVVEGASSLKVVTYDGETYEATLIGADTATDLAVIKVEASGLTPAEFGSSSDLQVGEQVIAAGNPGGMEFGFSTTVGYVSALNRSVQNNSTGFSMDCIQTDAAVNPGNSGGALVNEYGHVVGIVSSKIVMDAYEGLGFAIPIDTAQDVISNLEAYGYVKDRAVLGMSGDFVDSFTARFYGISPGWYIGSITNKSALNAGLQPGDVIVAIDGTPVDSSVFIASYLINKKPGDYVTLSVSRAVDNTYFDIQIVLEEYTGE